MPNGWAVLGMDVSGDLLVKWARWFAPEVQPFLLPSSSPLAGIGTGWVPADGPFELRDTFCIYQVPDGAVSRLLSEDEFYALPRAVRAELVRHQVVLGRELTPSVRSAVEYGDAAFADRLRAQADGHRFVWWPGLLSGREKRVLFEFVSEGLLPCRHGQVPDSVWRRCSSLLPQARELAGAFPNTSGPNCFATVMAAAGECDVVDEWVQRESFEAWLAQRTVAGGRGEDPGTVLVWRSRSGLVDHAAVTLGGGFALHKPSQGWMSPRKVLTVDEIKRRSRAPGRRLERRALVASTRSSRCLDS